jgi:DNA end-binding protein Ku
VALAERLVESMVARWDPTAFRDEYRDDVVALVERKVKAGKTKEVVLPEAPRETKRKGEVIDLMPLLERSMSRRVRTASAEPRRKPPATARRRRA